MIFPKINIFLNLGNKFAINAKLKMHKIAHSKCTKKIR